MVRARELQARRNAPEVRWLVGGDRSDQRNVTAARRGDRGARDRLARRHLDIVRALASRYRGHGLGYDDLVQEGSIGLLEAIDRYDSSRGVDFESFARFRVRRAIRNALTEHSRLIRLPKHMVERRRAISRLEENFVAARGRQPTAAELGSGTGLSAADIAQARAAAIKPVALEHDALESPGPIAVLADRNAPDPEAAALAAERSRALHAALWHLPPRQRHVVTRHFGLDAPESSLADLARDLGISERRVRAIEENALERLGRDLEPLS